jgi:hypothetical protein
LLAWISNYQTGYAMQKSTSSTRRVLLTVFITCIGFAGWPTLASAGLFSATGKIIAILSDDLFVGEAVGHLDGSGTISIRSQRNPNLTCRGEFTSSAELGGSGKMDCSDGTAAPFQFQRLTIYRGHGVATFSRGAMNFAYGFAPEEAAPYLKLPTGKKLKQNGTQLVLAD